MKSKYLFLLLLFCAFFACDKGGNAVNPGNGNDTTTEQHPAKKEINIEQALFINPVNVRSHTSDTRIMDTLIQYLDHTPEGAEVYLNIYLFSYEPVLKAVKSAYFRGVNMHVMIDHSRSSSIDENTKTIQQLQAMFNNGSSELVVVESDASSSAIDHHKHALFSEIDLPQGVAKNVVFSTSHNFVYGATLKVQDAVIMTNEKLYDAFLNNWKAMKKRARSGMKAFTYTVVDLDSIQVFFFPRRIKGDWDGDDTVLDILEKISDFSTAVVRVGMSDWTDGRMDVTKKLTELEEKGATVEVIAKDKADQEVLEELQRLKEAGGYVKILDMDPENIHSKFMMIKGVWNGKQQKIIMCGTHNLTANALKYNNEVIVMLKNSALFDDYWNYFDALKKAL